ncbi:MAG: arginase family protein [Candidatus Poseidoniales archaeon]
MAEGEDVLQFLDLEVRNGQTDIAVIQLPYELTTSYGSGTASGPKACVQASAQVELYDPLFGDDLPGDLVLSTPSPWIGTAGTLRGQLDEMVDFAKQYTDGSLFPLFLGGEHGILPPILEALKSHPSLTGDLSKLTVVQIDAHADLRSELDGEIFSHACAASRSIDMGIGRLMQVGIRAFSKEEFECIQTNEHITTFFARDTQHPCTGAQHWNAWIDMLQEIDGPVHLTIDIDGLDGSLVPSTGTPVPGGLQFWQAVETIEALFSNPHAEVISADVNEIVPQGNSPLTEFTAAMLATKIIGGHCYSRKMGFWKTNPQNVNFDKKATQSTFFSTWTEG